MKEERIVWSIMYYCVLVVSDFLVVSGSEIFGEKSQSSLLGCLRHFGKYSTIVSKDMD